MISYAMTQKFSQLTFVEVNCEFKPHGNKFIAIIRASYSQLYGGSKNDIYSLYIVDGDVIMSIGSWFDEKDLTELPIQDRNKAEKMVENFNKYKLI